MIICKKNGMIKVSGLSYEILRECSAVFASLVFEVSEETGFSLECCFDSYYEQMYDMIASYIKKDYAVLSKNYSCISSCSDCDAYDGERGGCTIPSCDLDYACSQRAERYNE